MVLPDLRAAVPAGKKHGGPAPRERTGRPICGAGPEVKIKPAPLEPRQGPVRGAGGKKAWEPAPREGTGGRFMVQSPTAPERRDAG